MSDDIQAQRERIFEHWRDAEHFKHLQVHQIRRMTDTMTIVDNKQLRNNLLSLMEYTGPVEFQPHNNYKVLEVYATNQFYHMTQEAALTPNTWTSMSEQRLLWLVTSQQGLAESLMHKPTPEQFPLKFSIGAGFYATPNFGTAAQMIFEYTTKGDFRPNRKLRRPLQTSRVFMPLACMSIANCHECDSMAKFESASEGVPSGFDSVCLRGVREPYLYRFLYFDHDLRARYHCGDWQINRRRVRIVDTTFFYTDRPQNLSIPFVVEISNDVGNEQYGNPALTKVNMPLLPY